jgi:hypothetical protein
MIKDPEIYIDPAGGGRLTVEALLRSEGSVELTLDSATFPLSKHPIFHIAVDDFWFNLGFVNGTLLFQRKEFALVMTEDFFKKLPNNKTVIASWTINTLTLLLGPIGFQGPDIKQTGKIEPRPAPLSLFKWARHQSLLPVVEHNSEFDFVSRVHTSLAFVQDKIDTMVNADIFWDIQYNGSSVLKRTPKKEKDLQPIFQGLLSDQCFISGIEVYPEFTTGVGRIDFLFVGYVKGKGNMKVCAEFKLAHSRDLEHGIEFQLPAYMINQQTENGTYCILDFRGKWFNEPKTDDISLHTRLGRAAKRGWPSLNNPIKLHHYYLGGKKKASKRV